MPNHVRHVLKFKNLKSKDDIDLIVNTIASPMTEDESDLSQYLIDFDKIIPEPLTKDDCLTRFLVTKDSHITERKDKPWFDWYKWRNAYWGTKWNAYDGYTKVGKSYITFVFNTAGSFPAPVIKRLALLGYNLEVKYADEDLGSNYGYITYTSEQGWKSDFERASSSKIKNPYRFAKNLWDRY